MSKSQTKVKGSNTASPEKSSNGQVNALTQEQIAAKAYQLYVESGCQEGRDTENWLRAEQLLRTRGSSQPAIA